MIEAGQMEPRVHHKSSPSSLLLNVSQNTPSCQSPAMEKSEVDLTRLCNINLTFKDNHYVSFHTLLDSGGFVENTSDDRRSHMLQFPGGSGNGVPSFEKGSLLLLISTQNY